MLTSPLLMPIVILRDSKKRLRKFRWGWAVLAFIAPIGAMEQFNRQVRMLADTDATNAATGALFGIVVAVCLGPYLMYRFSTRPKGMAALPADAPAKPDQQYTMEIEQRYLEMSDDELAMLDPYELTEEALACYERELRRRKPGNIIGIAADKAAARDNTSPVLLFQQAMEYLASDSTVKAKECLNRIVDDYPDSMQSLQALDELEKIRSKGWKRGRIIPIESRKKVITLVAVSAITLLFLTQYKPRSELHDAVEHGSSEDVATLIGQGVDPDATDYQGQTPLHIAGKLGLVEKAELLIKAGAKIDHADDSGDTALHEATREGHARLVEYLLARGADIEKTGHLGEPPLYQAVDRGHFDMALLLLEKGADVNQRKTNDDTPLHEASRNGNVAIATALIEQGAEINAVGSHGGTPIHRAAHYGHRPLVELLLKNGANADAREKNGYTPAKLADIGDYHDIVQLLTTGTVRPVVVAQRAPASGSAYDAGSAAPATYGNKCAGITYPIPTGWFAESTDHRALWKSLVSEGAEMIGMDKKSTTVAAENTPNLLQLFVSRYPSGMEDGRFNDNLSIALISNRGDLQGIKSGRDYLRLMQRNFDNKRSLGISYSAISEILLNKDTFYSLDYLLPLEDLTVRARQLAKINNDYLVVITVAAENDHTKGELTQLLETLLMTRVPEDVDRSGDCQAFRNQVRLLNKS